VIGVGDEEGNPDPDPLSVEGEGDATHGSASLPVRWPLRRTGGPRPPCAATKGRRTARRAGPARPTNGIRPVDRSALCRRGTTGVASRQRVLFLPNKPTVAGAKVRVYVFVMLRLMDFEKANFRWVCFDFSGYFGSILAPEYARGGVSDAVFGRSKANVRAGTSTLCGLA